MSRYRGTVRTTVAHNLSCIRISRPDPKCMRKIKLAGCKQDFLNRTFWKTEKQITKFRKSAIVGVWSACRLFENNIIKSVFLLCVWWYSTSRAVANRDQQSPNYIFAIKNIQLLEVVYRGVLFASLCLKRRHSWDNVRTLVTPTDN